ncbi:hypothetical protein WMY93_017938 [Mugilogobius chulae]|uniref:Uncharacterized protein n=1 Tax=Mugilogobius chulae TaxID=88201 RepID=A0AAW0NNC7_9GOBI
MEVVQDLEEIKSSLNGLSKDIATVTQQQAKLVKLVDEVKELRELLEEKERVIGGLERRIDDLEQYTRMEDVIINGLDTKHRSYARVAAAGTGGSVAMEGQDAPVEELLTLEQQVVTFLSNKDINIDPKEISACHLLPRKHSNAKPAIVVRFVNRKHKVALLRQARKLKGSSVFINEHLTSKNAEIARHARILWKQKKIQATWTRNGRVLIRLNGTPEQARVITPSSVSTLSPCWSKPPGRHSLTYQSPAPL